MWRGGMEAQVADQSREGGMLVECDVLVAEEDYAVLGKREMDAVVPFSYSILTRGAREVRGRASDLVEQAAGAKSLEVAADLVRPLSAVAHYVGGLSDFAEIGGEVEQAN